MRRSWLVAASMLSLSTVATAAAAQTPIGLMQRGAMVDRDPNAATIRDPWEGLNRKLYAFNNGLDKLIRPGVVFYHHATPTPVRNALHNALTNCTAPVIFINDVLQLKPQRAVVTAARFVVNTTVGVAGFADVAASGLNLPYHNADFGQTMGRYGVATGPYIFIPVLGPSTIRDVVGRGVDGVIDPLNVVRYDGRVELGIARVIGGGLDARDRADPLLKDIQRTATDPYAYIRSAYLQNRAAAVRGEETAASVKALPDFGGEPTSAPSPTPAPLPSSPAGAQTLAPPQG